MASVETIEKLAAHPEWIPPRSDVRVFLGEPGAPEATKTTVEPGNVFSPGMLTFGVTWWLRFPADGSFFATETAPLEALHWRYEEGCLPLIHCETQVHGVDVQHSLFQDGAAADYSEAVCGRLRLSNPETARRPVNVQVFIALRSLGPAGGPLPDLAVEANRRGFCQPKGNLPLLAVDRDPDAIGCGVGDPSPLARRGEVPAEAACQDKDGWVYGLLRYDVVIPAGGNWTLRLDCPQQTQRRWQHLANSRAVPRPEAFEARSQAHLEDWRARFAGIELDVPDQDFHNAFFAGVQHLLTAMVGDQAHIAALAYPLVWLRDGIYIMRCLDLAGFHKEARFATEYCVRNDFFGGFGAEGDAPGQGIWALVSHYRVTGDRLWLERVYPAIRRKVEWLFRMRRTTTPIQVTIDNPVLAFLQANRMLGLICMPASEGIIHGTMDQGIVYSVGFVNHWALNGLRCAAFAAAELGYLADEAAYQAEAADLESSLMAYIQRNPEYFEYERTANSLLWPTHAWEHRLDFVEEPFNRWWAKNRGSNDSDYQPEDYWLYFEFAQAHNALLLGQRERAWRVIQYRLQHQDLPGLYGWREGKDGVGMENAVNGVTLIRQLRGCQIFDSVTPHGWSGSEMWLLQRATLVEEWQDKLVLFSGIPETWLKPGARFGFRNLPSWYGDVSASVQVSQDGRSVHVEISGAVPGTLVQVRLPQAQKEAPIDDQGHLEIDL